MKEIKYALISQILIMLFGLGLALGATIGHPVYIEKIVKIMPEQIYPELVMEKAKKINGVLVAFYDDRARTWLFINKKGESCSLFKEVECED